MADRCKISITRMTGHQDFVSLSGTSEQDLRVDRPPSALSFATCGSPPATQGQRWEALAQLERLLLQAWQMAWKPLGR